MKRYRCLLLGLITLLIMGISFAACEAAGWRYAQFSDGLGNIIFGEDLAYGAEDSYKNVIGQSISMKKLATFKDFYMRAYLPKKLQDIDHNMRAFVLEFKGEGGAKFQECFVFATRVKDSSPKMEQRDQYAVMFPGFDGTLLPYSPSDYFTPMKPTTLKQIDSKDLAKAVPFNPKALAQWKKEFNLTAMDVTVLVYTFNAREQQDWEYDYQGIPTRQYWHEVLGDATCWAKGSFRIVFD